MKKFRINDNSSEQKEKFGVIPELTQRIIDRTLAQLEDDGIFVFPEIIRDAEDLTGEQMILQSHQNQYRTGNVVGFLGYGNERLTIASRFSSGEHDYFFQYMLEKAMDFPSIVNLQTDSDQENNLYLLLMFLFPYYLQQAMRKGLFKTYIRKEYNDGNVKGVIDIARHINQNTPFTGRIAYHQREYSYDNALTELVRHTVEFIKRKSYGNQILMKAKDEVKQIIDATQSYELFDRNKVITENLHNPIRHAYYREYRALQRLCILILKNQKDNIGTGANQICGILFDCAWLWEEYIHTLVKKWFYHPMNKKKKYAQYLFDKSIGNIYPDFIGKNPAHRIIADAKYKPFRNISGDDYLQVLAYMFRFDAKQGLYFYPVNPQKERIDDKKLMLNSGTSFEKNIAPREDICVKKQGFLIPHTAEDYTDFKSQMEKNEQEFIRRILTVQS